MRFRKRVKPEPQPYVNDALSIELLSVNGAFTTLTVVRPEGRYRISVPTNRAHELSDALSAALA